MDTEWVLARQQLWQLHEKHPDWGRRRLAHTLGHSVRWVRKWLQRLTGADLTDPTVWQNRSCARHTSPKRVPQCVIDRILAIRDNPPGHLRRTPGPRAILYFLHRDQTLQQQGVYLPRSTRTIWQILRQYSRIWDPPQPKHEPEERPAPMQHWSVDFKDVTTVPIDPEGKQQHNVECFNVIDDGTSILLSAQVRPDYNAMTVIDALVYALAVHGRPQVIRFDRDPRFIGASTSQDFPSAWVCLLLCLDIEPAICPPRRPDKNPFVERLNRNYKYDCLLRDLPETVSQAQAVTAVYLQHYNSERPNQAVTCGNQPPRVAFPDLPTLPSLPTQVDPDHWLTQIDGHFYTRRVQHNGLIQIGKQAYYISRDLKGRRVLLQVDAASCQFRVLLGGQLIKTCDIKGLHHQILDWEAYLTYIRREAESEWQLYLQRTRYSRR